MSSLTLQHYRYLYRITDTITPLHDDCGVLCGSACCQGGPGNDLGMYLFPGEEIMFTQKEDWLVWEKHLPRQFDFPASWQEPVYFIRCNGSCPRELRPLACRLFPLTPHLQKDGTLLIIYETMELPYRCPLIEQHHVLQNQFIQMVQQVWQVLLRDQKIRDMAEEDSRLREKQNQPVRPAHY